MAWGRKPCGWSRGLHVVFVQMRQFLPGPFSEDELLDLAGDGHGERVDEEHVARDLVGGNLAAAIGTNLLLGGRRALLQLHPGAGLFSILWIEYADELHIRDLRMAREE